MSMEGDKIHDGSSVYTAEASSNDSQYRKAASSNSNSYDTASGSRRANFTNNAAADLSYKTGSNGTVDGVAANQQPQENLWSIILNSVQSSRAVPVKNLIILGEQRTGKSTLLSNLTSTSSSSNISLSRQQENHTASLNGTADLGMGYSYFDIGDEDGEDVIARVGTFQICSTHPSHVSLLPLSVTNATEGGSRSDKHSRKLTAENANKVTSNDSIRAMPNVETLRDTLFLITLDWESPWTFLTQLLGWLDVIREVVEGAIGPSNSSKQSRERFALDELKESLEASIRSYKDPSGPSAFATADEDIGETSVASAIVPVSNPTADEGDEKTPLPEGSLTHNLGVPLIIVCTKADTIPQLERDRNFKEEKFDYIQQVLRTISLKYGAGLFFTAQSRPKSFEILRSYILHRLFGSDTRKTTERSFAFHHRPSTVERDVLVVPAGWDSFGKIRALRDSFDCAGMANGWEWDCQVERIRRRERLPRMSRQAEDIAEQECDRRSLSGLVEGDANGIESTVKLYEAIVEDWDAQALPSSAQSSPNRVKEPDNQAFLMQHFTSMQKEVEVKNKTSLLNNNTGQASAGSTRSVVGPLGSSSLSLPNVERVMQERQLNDEGRSGKTSTSSSRAQSSRDKERRSERDAGRSTPAPRHAATSAMQSPPPLSSSDKTERGASRPTSPLSSAQTGGQTPKQSEVLHSFFQSLLKEKGGGGTGASGRSGSTRTHATAEREREREHDRDRERERRT